MTAIGRSSPTRPSGSAWATSSVVLTGMDDLDLPRRATSTMRSSAHPASSSLFSMLTRSPIPRSLTASWATSTIQRSRSSKRRNVSGTYRDLIPLGSGADLFYGPIQQGKDGWGAAFFCGSNAVLRREALMALGLTMFSRSAAERVRKALHDGRRRVQAAVNIHLPGDIGQIIGRRAVGLLVEARRGSAVATCSRRDYVLRRQIKSIALSDMLPQPVIDAITDTLGAAEVARTDRALAIDPIVTSSITEDMATAMHLHALGWASVYHHEVLVQGLAPEDVRTMLSQRQRWATGTMQVFFSDNPLLLRGLTIGQRLMYLATMTSYLNGFAAVVYIAAPMVFLVSGIFPIRCDSIAFFVYFMPFFLCSQTLFVVAGNRSRGYGAGSRCRSRCSRPGLRPRLPGGRVRRSSVRR